MKKNIVSGIVGNILEHYDNALYSLLVPFFSPLFFPKLSYLSGLIAAYGIQIIGILLRPLGALVFGRIGDVYGRKRALIFTILGMSLTTFLFGCLPTYETVGELAPIFLLVFRGLQNFFAGGEVKGGAIFVLEHGEKRWRGFLSSLYDASTLMGILLASIVVTCLSRLEYVEIFWRYLFWFGALGGFFGLSMRYFCTETPEFSPKSKGTLILDAYPWASLWKNKKIILAIAVVSGFSYVTYAVPCILMNSFLPLVSSITKTEAMKMNTYLLALDMCLLPLFGLLVRWIAYDKIMKMASVTLAIVAIPLFVMLENVTVFNAIAIRMTIVILGVAFAAPIHQWTLELVSTKDRCLITSFASSLGTQIFGAPCVVIALGLFQCTGWVVAPAFYLFSMALAASFALIFTKLLPQRLSDEILVLK